MKKMRTIFALALICTIAVVAFQVSTVKASETFIWGAAISSDGTSVMSPILEAGVQYRIVARGNWWYDVNGRLLADAQYYTTIPTSISIWDNHFAAPDGASFLQINGQNMSWGPFSNGIHEYTIYYTGTGSSIAFAIVDWMDGDTSNNSCHIDVEIWAPEMGEGFTPGYWKNHPEAWVSYMPSDIVGDVFDVFGTMPDEFHCDLGDYTLMGALNFGGGKGVYGAAMILLRAATAAILNGAHPDVDYPLTDGEVINLVNNAIASHDRGTIIDLAEQLDMYNNFGGSMD